MDTKRVLTPDELARELQLQRSTILELARGKKIPSLRIGGKIVRFVLADVIEAMKKTKKPKSA